MGTTILKGQPFNASVRFPHNDVFADPPDWELRDWNDTVIQSGTALSGQDNTWSATFTLSKSMNIPNGTQNLEIAFDGVTLERKYKEKSKELTVVDLDADWESYGILYYPRGNLPQTVKVKVLLPEPAAKITAEIRNGYGAGDVLFSRTYTTPVETSSSELGYAYAIEVPNVLLPFASGGYYPHQLIIASDLASGGQDMVIKPIYTLTPQALSHLTTLKRYLDKARLEEIDPNIGWQDEELLHYLLQGAMMINGINDVSYWTVETMPSSLLTHLMKAAEHEALNARYLAEGMIEFDWQGANTQLTINRKEAIQTKMDELGAFLDAKLPAAKKSAIAHFGPGIPPAGVQVGRKAIGGLTLNLGPMTNISIPFGRRSLYGPRG